MALYGFNGMGWFAAGLSVALGGYMVMSQGAAERARLHSLETRIAAAKKEIRSLETEFNARANQAQLERWNGDAMRMAAPAPQQYLASESQLADLDRSPAEVQTASLVVPAGAPRATIQPAVATRTETAQNGSAAGQASRPANRAVAMIEPSSLISASTMSDLQRAAVDEKLALR